MIVPRMHLRIDGQPVPMEDDWQASQKINLGDDRFSARVPDRALARVSAEQEAPIRLYDDSGACRWGGKMERDPTVQDGFAEIEANGYGHDADAEVRRALFLSRDISKFSPLDDPPFEKNDPGNAAFESGVEPSKLFWRLAGGTQAASGDRLSFAFWAPGSPGGITSVAGERTLDGGTFSSEYRLHRFTGPSGADTLEASFGTGSGAFDESIDSPEDAIFLQMRLTASFGPSGAGAHRFLQLRKIRVRGIASLDTMTDGEVMNFLAGQLGWDAGGVVGSGLNAMPLDHQSGAWRKVPDFVATLADRYWAVFVEDDVPVLHYAPFGDEVYTVSRAAGARHSLARRRQYNRVTVPYKDVGGAIREAFADADPDPFGGRRGIINFPFDELPDVQENADLASQVAAAQVAHLSQKLWRGDIAAHRIRAAEGNENPYAARVGGIVRIADWGPLESTEHRIASVQMSERGTVLGIEDSADAPSVLARLARSG